MIVVSMLTKFGRYPLRFHGGLINLLGRTYKKSKITTFIGPNHSLRPDRRTAPWIFGDMAQKRDLKISRTKPRRVQVGTLYESEHL